MQESVEKLRAISTIHGQIESFNPEKIDFISLKRKIIPETPSLKRTPTT